MKTARMLGAFGLLLLFVAAAMGAGNSPAVGVGGVIGVGGNAGPQSIPGSPLQQRGAVVEVGPTSGAPTDGQLLELWNRDENFVLDGANVTIWKNTCTQAGKWPDASNTSSVNQPEKVASGVYFDANEWLSTSISYGLTTGTVIVCFQTLSAYSGSYDGVGDVQENYFFFDPTPHGYNITQGPSKSSAGGTIWFLPVSSGAQNQYVVTIADNSIATYSGYIPNFYTPTGREFGIGNTYQHVYGLRGVIGGFWVYNRAITYAEALQWKNYL